MNKPRLEFTCSRHFTTWLADQHISLAFSAYEVGKFFLVGLKPDGKLEIFNRTFQRSMGLHASPQTLFLSSIFQLWRFENALQPGQTYRDYDRVYVPQLAWTTGDLDIHDIGVRDDGLPVFVNTLFSCLATVSDRYSFRPLWQPPFISRLAAEDRCHLNGLAMRDGTARYVTAVSRSDVADGWREKRTDGGIVIDVGSNDIVLEGLSMPHSPRWHDDRLWLLDSGNGYFGYADLGRGVFERVSFCPGYGRGMCFFGDHAVIGVSRPRHETGTFAGLALEDELRKKDAEPRCSILVVDIRSGDIVHWLRIEGIVTELYDVAVIANTRRPMAIGLQTKEIHQMLSVDV